MVYNVLYNIDLCKITHENIDWYFDQHYDIIAGVLWTILVTL